MKIFSPLRYETWGSRSKNDFGTFQREKKHGKIYQIRQMNRSLELWEKIQGGGKSSREIGSHRV